MRLCDVDSQHLASGALWNVNVDSHLSKSLLPVVKVSRAAVCRVGCNTFVLFILFFSFLLLFIFVLLCSCSDWLACLLGSFLGFDSCSLFSSDLHSLSIIISRCLFSLLRSSFLGLFLSLCLFLSGLPLLLHSCLFGDIFLEDSNVLMQVASDH